MMGLIQSIYYPDYLGIGKTGPQCYPEYLGIGSDRVKSKKANLYEAMCGAVTTLSPQQD